MMIDVVASAMGSTIVVLALYLVFFLINSKLLSLCKELRGQKRQISKLRSEIEGKLTHLGHRMDMADGAADGVPAGLQWMATAPWVGLIVDRLRKKHGEKCRKVLGSYACTNEAEVFAVAVEFFFERPTELKQKDGKLYAMLESYFNVDPLTGKLLQE